MQNILFYNSDRGAGAVGRVENDSFRTTQDLGTAFSTGWSDILPINGGPRLFFYNKDSSAGTAIVSNGKYSNGSSWSPGFFAKDWSLIANIPGSFTLFYLKVSGSGAIASLGENVTTIKEFPAESFEPNWTHIVAANHVILFYKKHDGAAAIAEPFNNKSSHGGFSLPNDIRTLRTFTPGSFATGWSHIVVLRNQGLLFYNSATGQGALGRLNRDGFQTLKEFRRVVALPGVGVKSPFRPGWTGVVAAGDTALFYSQEDGSAVLGFDPVLHAFPTGSFSTGWTHLTSTTDEPIVR